MTSTKIVTSFLVHNDKYLILKRSEKVKSMKGLWAGISGIIEGDEKPTYRAKREILEEVGITENKISLLKSAQQIRVDSPQYANHEWLIFPFLFSVQDPIITLNWENQEYGWIRPSELSQYQTVPSLDKVLASLL
ncbi:MAG: NUDIX domain-containing protein [Nitrosotalea sp.]